MCVFLTAIENNLLVNNVEFCKIQMLYFNIWLHSSQECIIQNIYIVQIYFENKHYALEVVGE